MSARWTHVTDEGWHPAWYLRVRMCRVAGDRSGSQAVTVRPMLESAWRASPGSPHQSHS